MRRRVVALVVAIGLAGCNLATPSPSVSDRPATIASLTPALGLTWSIAPDVELPADAFPIDSNPPTGPEHPNTAGHPGHFPGQSVIEDVASIGERVVAVGYEGLAGEWRARAWSSSDGLSWRLASIDDRPGTFAVGIVRTPRDGFVAVGWAGADAAAWTSPDGVIWARSLIEREPRTITPAPAERMRAVVASSDGLVAGGSAGPELGDRHARFWRSTDGRSWSVVADDGPAFANAEVAALVSPGGSGFLALGRLGPGGRPSGSIAWTSPDGQSWHRIDDGALASGLAVSVITTATGFLAVGSDADEREAVAWASSDGQAWTRAPKEESRLHFGEKVRMTDVVATDRGYVAIGNYVGVQFGTGTSWLSTDGLHWAQAPDQPTFGQAEPEAIAPWHDGLVIVGSRGAPDNYIPSVWLSPGLP